jgi:NAD(P)-dependent dehydrogenase (short-subunit alcohol dehydrogenase family)
MKEAGMTYLDDRANLRGKVAVVTGGAGGLGWPIVRDFMKAGVQVALCDRDAAAIEAIASEMQSASVKTLLRLADVRDPVAMDAFFQEIDREFGRIDILVNVPGGGFVAPLLETRPKGWQAVASQNFFYILDTTQQAARRMIAQGQGGSIIYITSIEAHRGVPNRAIYGSMKAAVAHLAKTLAMEFHADGIRVNCIAPDIFPTPNSGGSAFDPQSPQGKLERTISVPMGRYGEGDDLTGCVLFLASDLASYVTGATLHVDGGTYASSGWFHWPDQGWMNTPTQEIVDMLASASTQQEGSYSTSREGADPA